MWKNESTGRIVTDSHYKTLTPAHKQQYSPYTPPAKEETQVNRKQDEDQVDGANSFGDVNAGADQEPEGEGIEPQTDQEPEGEF